MSNIPIYTPQTQIPATPQISRGGSPESQVASTRAKIGSKILAGATSIGNAIANKRQRDWSIAKQKADEAKREARRKESIKHSVEAARSDAFDTHVSPILANAVGKEIKFIEDWIANPENHNASSSNDLMQEVQDRLAFEAANPDAEIDDVLKGRLTRQLYDQYAEKEGHGDIGPAHETRKRRHIDAYYKEVLDYVRSPALIKRLTEIENEAVSNQAVRNLNETQSRLDNLLHTPPDENELSLSEQGGDERVTSNFDRTFIGQLRNVLKSTADTYPHSVDTFRNEVRGRAVPQLTHWVNRRRQLENLKLNNLFNDPSMNGQHEAKAEKIGSFLANSFIDFNAKIEQLRPAFSNDPKLRSEFNDLANMMRFQWKRNALDSIKSYSNSVPLTFVGNIRELRRVDPDNPSQTILVREETGMVKTFAQLVLSNKDFEEQLRMSGDSRYFTYDNKGHGTRSADNMSYNTMFSSSRASRQMVIDYNTEKKIENVWDF